MTILFDMPMFKDRTCLIYISLILLGCTGKYGTDSSETDSDTASDSDTETDSDSHPCSTHNESLVEWLPTNWDAVAIRDDQWGFRDDGLRLPELSDHPNWGYRENLYVTLRPGEGELTWTYRQTPYKVTEHARPQDRPPEVDDVARIGLIKQHDWEIFTLEFPDQGFEVSCRRAIVPTFAHNPFEGSHLICTDTEGRWVRFWHDPPFGIPEVCRFDGEPVSFPMRWAETVRTVGEVTTIIPHDTEIDGKAVADMRELWLHEDFTGGYSHLVVNGRWDNDTWLLHEEYALHRDVLGDDSWRFGREDGHTMDCQQGDFSLDIPVTQTMPFALHCIDSDGVISEWNPHDVAARSGWGVNEHPGGWWVIKQPL